VTIEEFVQKYPSPTRPVSKIVQRWIVQKELRDFLGMPIMAGVTTLDVLVGDRLVDTLSPEVKQAFTELMGTRADTRAEIERLILEKFESGEEAVLGLMNKIQGQMGEDIFVQLAGPVARLAPSKSQEGWDVRVEHGDHLQYVQVKVHEDPNGVVEQLESLQQKILDGTLRDGDAPIARLDIAVNSEIYAEVKERAVELGYPGQILDLGETRMMIREGLSESFEHTQAPFEHFFGELLGDALNPAIVHALANAFLLYKGAKDRRTAVEDTLYSAGLSAGGLLAATTVDQLLGHGLFLLDLHDAAALLSGPVGGFLLLGVSMGSRALLIRILDRRFVVVRLAAGNDHLAALIPKVQAYSY
jgi:hypothetical protein